MPYWSLADIKIRLLPVNGGLYFLVRLFFLSYPSWSDLAYYLARLGRRCFKYLVKLISINVYFADVILREGLPSVLDELEGVQKVYWKWVFWLDFIIKNFGLQHSHQIIHNNEFQVLGGFLNYMLRLCIIFSMILVDPNFSLSRIVDANSEYIHMEKSELFE